MMIDMPYDGRRNPPRPGLATAYSNKHHEALEFNYVYRAPTREKNKINHIMTVLYVLSLCFVIMIVIGAITFNPRTPVYHVNDVRVKNFTTKPILTGEWYTNITVYNPNKGRFGLFHEFKLYFMHNNDVLAGSTMPGFYVDKNHHKIVEGNASTTSENVKGMVQPKLTLDSLEKEIDNLFIVVDLKIIPVTIFIPKIRSYVEGKAMALCPGLKIKFQKNTLGEGRLDKSDGQPNFCRIIILPE